MGKDKKEKADARLTNVDVSMHTTHEPFGAGATLIIRRAAKLHFASILIRPCIMDAQASSSLRSELSKFAGKTPEI